jgi:glycosyltransferase involved in cell wall biosynthesis
VTGPLVSVVIIVRNGERFLASAIESVRAQDYRPLEVVVVDGHSSDSTRAIAASYPDVRLIAQAGRGVADAYNVGIAAARGELIAFLSHDDLWTEDKLATQVRYLREHPDVQYCVARVKFFLESGSSPPPGFKPELLTGDHVGYVMETLVARREVFRTVGGFDGALSVSNDTDWFARAKDAGVAMAVVPRVLLMKRLHGENLTGNAGVVQRELMDVIKHSLRRQRAGRRDEGPGPGESGPGRPASAP